MNPITDKTLRLRSYHIFSLLKSLKEGVLNSSQLYGLSMFFRTIVWCLFFYKTTEYPTQNQLLGNTTSATENENEYHSTAAWMYPEVYNSSSQSDWVISKVVKMKAAVVKMQAVVKYTQCKEVEITFMRYYEDYYIPNQYWQGERENLEETDPEFYLQLSNFSANPDVCYQTILPLYGYSYNAENKTVTMSSSINSTSPRQGMDIMEEWLWFLHTIKNCKEINSPDLKFWKDFISSLPSEEYFLRVLNVLGLIQYEAKTKTICEFPRENLNLSRLIPRFLSCLVEDHIDYEKHGIFSWKQIEETKYHKDLSLMEPTDEDFDQVYGKDSFAAMIGKMGRDLPTTRFRNMQPASTNSVTPPIKLWLSPKKLFQKFFRNP